MIERKKALERLERESFDVVVIGGGITGAGVALDAASRGYSVALVERDDYAAGTSSRSSKMVHGGLRYLEHFDLGLVREALLERQLLVELAPHLVKPIPFIVPAFEGARKPLRMGVGLNLYDVLSTTRFGQARKSTAESSWHPSRHRNIDGDEVAELVPALAPRNPSSGYLFYDCQTDDVRLVLSVLGEAERFGTVSANGVEAVELSEAGGRAVGVVCRETGSEATFEIKAGNVINATGVWADRIRPDEIHDEEGIPRIRPSRGTHILLSPEQVSLNAAVIVPAGSGRSVFALPWLGRTLVGTTDNDYEGSLEHPNPDREDVSYLLDAVNEFFVTDLDAGDVVGAFAGVRPLISTGDAKRSVDISRNAELYETSSGLLTITGGKLTTYRSMAKTTVDRLVDRDGTERPCVTHEIPIGRPVDPASLPDVEGVSGDQARALADRYGEAASRVLELAADRSELGKPIVEGLPDLLAEAAFAAGHEQAGRLQDVLLRRTRLGLLAPRRLCDGDGTSRRIAKAMGRELGWGRLEARRAAKAWQEAAQEEGLVVEGEVGVAA